MCTAWCRAAASSPDGEHWIACRPGFFLPVRVLSRLFRRLFLEQSAARVPGRRAALLCSSSNLARRPRLRRLSRCLPRKPSGWSMPSRPSAAPHVLDYLARYTHRVAISNNRLSALDRRQGHLPLEGLPPPRQAKTMTSRRRVHPPLPAARSSRTGSSTSAITAFLPTATAHRSSPTAVVFWRRQPRRRRHPPPTIASVIAVSQVAPWTSVRAAAAPWPRSARCPPAPSPPEPPPAAIPHDQFEFVDRVIIESHDAALQNGAIRPARTRGGSPRRPATMPPFSYSSRVYDSKLLDRFAAGFLPLLPRWGSIVRDQHPRIARLRPSTIPIAAPGIPRLSSIRLQ